MEKIDWNAVRSEFPVCSRYTYLNAAGGSPLSSSAAIEGKRFYDEMLTYGDTYWDIWLERTKRIRENTAKFIGAHTEEIAFISNTSSGMGIIANMLNKCGDIITMEDEFPSSTIPWLNLGYKIDYIKSVDGFYPVEHIEKQIKANHKILITSYVQFNTGFRQDLEALGRLCRRKNLIFIVNATQALGIFPVDTEKYNIDFLVFTGLKWAGAGYGAAVLYINNKMHELFQMPLVGWRSVKFPDKMDNKTPDINNCASAIESGCPSFPTIFALGGALNVFLKLGKQNCMERVLFLSSYLKGQLVNNGIKHNSNFNSEQNSGIVIIPHSNAHEIVSKLAENNIIVSARGAGIRISVNIFNNEQDINTFISNLNLISHK